MAKKTVDIEALVRWAYRDELPRAVRIEGPMAGIRSGSMSLLKLHALGAVVQEMDIRNRFGLFPEQAQHLCREPHEDAQAVYEAVEDLAGLVFEPPPGWNPLCDLGDLGAEGADAIARGLDRLITVEMRDGRGNLVAPYGGLEEGEVVTARPVMRRSPARLIIRHALLGGCPAWEADVPERKVAVGANGKPGWFRKIVEVSDGAFAPARYEVEVDGFDYKRRRPYADAYRKTYLDPDPVEVVVDRAEYELWHAALAHLVERLAGRLRDHEALPSPRLARPWEAGLAAG